MSMENTAAAINDEQVASFHRDGFIRVPNLVPDQVCAKMREFALASLSPLLGPAEFETDVRYPGSPLSYQDPGGLTPRRLLHAYTRHPLFRDFATGAAVSIWLRALMGTDSIAVSQNHHNCLMAKHPGYSSATHWHQDMRYWRFDRPELVNVWLALGRETPENGCLRVIPGSHKLNFDRGRFDAELFFREDVSENQALIATAIDQRLNPGDGLFFHCRTLHYAGKNHSEAIKFSLVFTYHSTDNHPIPETRSARYPDIVIG